MRILSSIVIGCFVSIIGHCQSTTLAECIDMGISRNLAVDNARIGISQGHAGVSQSRAKLLPVIQGVAQFTDYLRSPVNVTTGTLLGNEFPDSPTWQTIKSTQYNSNAGVQLTAPLYNQTILAAIDVARTVEEIKSLSYELAVESLTMQIGKVYYLAQTSKEQLRLTGINMCRMDELCVITDALYEQGMVMDVDKNRVNINRKMLEAEREVTHTLYQQQLNMLRYLMNLDMDAPLDVVPMPESFEPVIIGNASDELPEIMLAYKQKELIDCRIKSVRAGFMPTLTFTGYAGGVGYSEKLSQFADNWFANCFIGVSLRIPLFEANSKRLQIRQLRYDAEQAENSIAMLRKQIDKNYADAVLQLRKSIEIVGTQTECRKQAESVYIVTEEQYKEGIASMTALLQDDMQLRSAQSACIQAVCQSKLAQLELLRLTGCLDKLSEQ